MSTKMLGTQPIQNDDKSLQMNQKMLNTERIGAMGKPMTPKSGLGDTKGLGIYGMCIS